VDETADTPGPLRQRRILVVDDHGDAAALLAVLLQLEGHDVQTACNGQEAIEKAEVFRPEVILMDLAMPDIDGLEACRRIRARPWGNRIIIAAVSGLSRNAYRRRTHEAGFDLHFAKPVDTTSLLVAITAQLSSRAWGTNQSRALPVRCRGPSRWA
jgi:CheY-like chemotaxis protein